MDTDQVLDDLHSGRIHSVTEHLTECGEDSCEACSDFMEFYSACDSCGCWMNKAVEYAFYPETGHTYCIACDDLINRNMRP